MEIEISTSAYEAEQLALANPEQAFPWAECKEGMRLKMLGSCTTLWMLGWTQVNPNKPGHLTDYMDMHEIPISGRGLGATPEQRRSLLMQMKPRHDKLMARVRAGEER